eukprot:354557-Amphidinium_carterae.1
MREPCSNGRTEAVHANPMPGGQQPTLNKAISFQHLRWSTTVPSREAAVNGRRTFKINNAHKLMCPALCGDQIHRCRIQFTSEQRQLATCIPSE